MSNMSAEQLFMLLIPNIGTAFFYSGLNLNQYSVASPCRTICTVCGFVALS
ncbi:TPA: hypothetical protein WIV18_000518 [Neisseria meningitidis]|uniref:hypothetical protein n=1 Tax=Neisseria meningitidis TaxID=487 RepID=UPI00129EB382|nr:hypothetical protein [Neisseria meningitidis]MBJ7851906.1 hypothetical protein [Neisseria meningitidis]MBW3909269.1 hypothetical protein [Neisseria meningitidis]MBW3913281.1 hypothetical protein [Neisseria meningitidis]MBW3915086.1 hypothetical protein [Neisseria meningitidis]MBW3996240.1 hypothetical protein [Neisseria meningitidis]